MVLRAASLPNWLALLAVLGLLPISQAADVPPRSEGGQTLAVPEEHLKLGDVYYVTPGEDTQVLCTSDAPLQRVAATCRRVVGYVVTPFEIEGDQAPLLTGAFRIPAAAFKTGGTDFDQLLRSPPMLNAAECPEVTFCLTRVSDAKLVSEEKGRRNYTLTLAGELKAKDKSLALEMPAQVGFIPFTWQTMGRNVGELLVLRSKFDVKLSDLGVEKPDRSFTERVADVVHVEVCLFCNTMTPEKLLDPAIKREHHLRQLRFLTLVRDFDDPEQGYDFGRTFRKEIWDDAQALNRLAWATLTEDGLATRDLGFALQTAQRANELTEFKDPTLLSTLSRACADKGDLDAAVKWSRAAAAQLETAKPDVAEQVRAALARYEAQAAKNSD
jgi:polyisoprenoid-binding protein YceI